MIGYNRQLTSHFDTSTLHLPQLDGYVQTAPLLCSFPLDPELRALLKCSSCCYSENQSLVSLFLKKALPEHCYYYSALSSSYYQNIVPCQCCKQPSLSGFWTDDALFTIFCATGNLSDWWNVVHFTCRKSFLLQLLLHSLCSSYYTTTSSSSEWCTRCFVLKVLITFPHSFFNFLWCLYCFS